ncbi:hypothetical protein ACLOJK_008429 [Asimina triloba]
MAVSTSKAVDVPALIAYGDDLISLLKNKKEINGLIHSVDGAKKLLSSCQAESSELQIQIQDYQNKISACKQSIDEAKNETGANTELERLQNELEEELEKEKVLREELR